MDSNQKQPREFKKSLCVLHAISIDPRPVATQEVAYPGYGEPHHSTAATSGCPSSRTITES